MPEHVLTSLTIDDRAARWEAILGDTDPAKTAVFVACDGELVLGFGSCGPQRTKELAAQGYSGEISALYVLSIAQRQGFGRRLIGVMATDLIVRGFASATLWVLRDNIPARRFYEKLGGIVVGEREDRRGEETLLLEVAYVWRDLALLTHRT